MHLCSDSGARAAEATAIHPENELRMGQAGPTGRVAVRGAESCDHLQRQSKDS